MADKEKDPAAKILLILLALALLTIALGGNASDVLGNLLKWLTGGKVVLAAKKDQNKNGNGDTPNSPKEDPTVKTSPSPSPSPQPSPETEPYGPPPLTPIPKPSPAPPVKQTDPKTQPAQISPGTQQAMDWAAVTAGLATVASWLGDMAGVIETVPIIP